MKKPVYLDYHSTTPCDIRVVKAMEPYFSECFGNPSAVHSAGEEAKEAIEEARVHVARMINAPPECVFFTSGATASNNILLQGLLLKCRRILGPFKEVNIITTQVEHGSVLECLKEMRYRDEMHHKTHYLSVDSDGNLIKEELEKALLNSLDTLAVSIMAANNEIGTVYDIENIGQICRGANVFFHTDATQAIGKIDIDVEKMHIDALSMSAHKIYGPKGVGALYMRNKNKILPLMSGGYQEVITSGTINAPAIVGFGKACELLLKEKDEENKRTKILRDRLLYKLQNNIDNIIINGTMKNRLPNNLNVTIKGVKAEVFVLGMDDIIVSSGAACGSRSPKPSHVLTAIGNERPEFGIRFGLGKDNTEEEIDYTADRIIEITKSIRSN